MKPLINAIPSKILILGGRPYRVYDVVRLHTQTPRQQTYQKLIATLNNKKIQKSVKLFSHIRDIHQREVAVHSYIREIVQKINDFVELNYQGDRLRYDNGKTKYNVGSEMNRGHRYTYVRYVFRSGLGRSVSSGRLMVGRTDNITQEEIDARVKQAVDHQTMANSKYNEALAAKHKAFRALVDKQLVERAKTNPDSN